MPKLFSGAEIVFKCLEDQKVEYIFGYPGGAVLPIYDEFKNPSFKYNMTLYQELAIASGCGIKITNIDDCVARWIGFITKEELAEVKKDRKLMKGIIVAINEMNRQQNQSQNEPSEEQKQQTLTYQAR